MFKQRVHPSQQKKSPFRSCLFIYFVSLVSLDPNRGGTNGDSNSSSGDNRHAEVIVLASIVSVLCFVLGIAISVSILICLKLKRSHQKDLEVLGSSHVSYKNLSTVMGDSEY